MSSLCLPWALTCSAFITFSIWACILQSAGFVSFCGHHDSSVVFCLLSIDLELFLTHAWKDFRILPSSGALPIMTSIANSVRCNRNGCRSKFPKYVSGFEIQMQPSVSQRQILSNRMDQALQTAVNTEVSSPEVHYFQLLCLPFLDWTV